MNPIWIHHWLNNSTNLAFFFKADDICSAFGISDWSVSGRCHYTHEYTNVFKFLYIDGHYTNLDGK